MRASLAIMPRADLAHVPVSTAERMVRTILERADIGVNGRLPHDLRVNDPSFYRRILLNPAYEFGQTYVDGLWDCPNVDQLSHRLFTSSIGHAFEHGWQFRARTLVAKMRNLQSRIRARIVADRHYDLSNDLFESILDPTMAYTCAMWKGQNTLEGAQHAKMAAICRKLDLKPTDHMLDIGCGWGGLVQFAAKNHGARGTGLTISQNQHAFAQDRLRSTPGTQLRLMDYRDIRSENTLYEKVASVEMIEAVGPKNYGTFMQTVHDAMRPGGAFLLQCFISHRSVNVCNEWFDRHIFPNGVSPSLALLSKASESTFGAPEEIENIGLDYDPTLMAWNQNLTDNWSRLAQLGYDERFKRTWHFYLLSLAGIFRAEHLRCYQILYRKGAWRSGSFASPAASAK